MRKLGIVLNRPLPAHVSVSVIVVVPDMTTDRANALVQKEGAEVLVHGASSLPWDFHPRTSQLPLPGFQQPIFDAALEA
jgi:hypothetical protein